VEYTSKVYCTLPMCLLSRARFYRHVIRPLSEQENDVYMSRSSSSCWIGLGKTGVYLESYSKHPGHILLFGYILAQQGWLRQCQPVVALA